MTPRCSGDALPRLLDAAVPGGLVVRTGAADMIFTDRARGAMFSRCDRYRYLLWRIWQPDLPFWTFGMLNPSTADHLQLDSTVRRCVDRAATGGAGGIVVWNLFAWRSTDPAAMKRADDPVGPANDGAIMFAVRDGAVNVAAWGVHGRHLGRADEVRELLAVAGVPLNALAFTTGGEPRHPLYLSSSVQPQPWSYVA